MKNASFKENEIVTKKSLGPQLEQLDIYVPHVTRNVLPGQFVVLRTDEQGERLPLTVVQSDRKTGIIRLIIQIVGVATRKLDSMKPGDIIMDVAGPLGRPTHIEKVGTVVVIGGGVGTAPTYPITKAMKAIGNRIVSIIGARSRDMLILTEEMKALSDRQLICTDDGSAGEKGFVTELLQKLIDQGELINQVVAIGPAVMMAAVSSITKKYHIPTLVSLNALMVDATGMCGGCRVTVGGETKFVCVDGPEFNGHEVNFDELIQRSGTYKKQEKRAVELHQCRLDTTKVESKKNQHEVSTLLMEPSHQVQEKSKSQVEMPKQAPEKRVHNFDEVALGYTAEMAMAEASRCLQCKKAPCISGCPVSIDIPAFIAKIMEKDFIGSIQKIKEMNSLPAICGRVCPQEEQCELKCVLNKKGNPISIGRLERFAADYETALSENEIIVKAASTGKKVAVIGAGPAGLTVSGELAKMGHAVTIFEALHKSGGVLAYGIPEFRLPKRIVRQESAYIEKLGVEIKLDHVIGRTFTIDQLFEKGYHAVFIGTGAGLPYFMGIEGENLNGVYSANEFLTRVNLMKAYKFPEYDTPIYTGDYVAVVGGGNVAMDSARCARRLNTKKVFLVYRRAREQMPAREEEIQNAFEEGIEPHLLTNPVRIIGDERGWVKEIECIRMELGEPDSSGRRRPIPIDASEFTIRVDTVVMAIGQGANPLLTKTTPDLKLNKWDNIVADEQTGKTSKRGVFAGGDIVTGAATVILAMGAGKKAAFAIDEYLKTDIW
ncbi:NADPH-dependent glutamate synthase [bacterium]|nr:NADPH-dependent glutamate synthase [bacterium]